MHSRKKGQRFVWLQHNLNSDASVISIWRFAGADLRNALFSSIAETYAVGTFYDAEHAKVAKLLINGVHHVTEEGYCVPDIVNIGFGGKSTTAERLYESYADGVEGKGILTGDNELPPEIMFDLGISDMDGAENLEDWRRFTDSTIIRQSVFHLTQSSSLAS